MGPRESCLACLEREPAALFEAALWLAAEHDAGLRPGAVLAALGELQQQVAAALPALPAAALAQPLLRRLADLGFVEVASAAEPRDALLHQVLKRRRGLPLALALIALELARRLAIPLQPIDFPAGLLLKVPGADHLLDPGTGRRLYPRDCRELLRQHGSGDTELSAAHFRPAEARGLLQRLSRELCRLHRLVEDDSAALRDAERVLQLGDPSAADHLLRAELYQRLGCPQGERFDLQRALLLSDDPAQRLQLGERLRRLSATPALH